MGAVVMVQHMVPIKCVPLLLHITLWLSGYLHTVGFPWDHGHPALVLRGASINTAQTRCLLLPDQDKLVQ